MSSDRGAKVTKTDDEWRNALTPEQYHVTRQHGTGVPSRTRSTGGPACSIACVAGALFSSDTKFESGTGWPSFWAPVGKDAVSEHEDRSWFMRRTEVRCAACDAISATSFPMAPPARATA